MRKKKKLIVVYGINSDVDKLLMHNVFDELSVGEYCVIKIKSLDSYFSLRNVLEALKPHEENYNNVLVLYSGENLSLLQKDLPCPRINITELRVKMTNHMFGVKTERDQEVLAQAISAVILRKLDHKPIVNQREY